MGRGLFTFAIIKLQHSCIIVLGFFFSHTKKGSIRLGINISVPKRNINDQQKAHIFKKEKKKQKCRRDLFWNISHYSAFGRNCSDVATGAHYATAGPELMHTNDCRRRRKKKVYLWPRRRSSPPVTVISKYDITTYLAPAFNASSHMKRWAGIKLINDHAGVFKYQTHVL